MATSKLIHAVELCFKILEPICGQGNHCCKSLYLELGSDWFALCSFAAVYMDSVPSSCLMLQQGWPTRMFQHGTVIFAGKKSGTNHGLQFVMFWSPMYSSCVDRLLCAGSARIFQLYCVETRWMWRTGRWKQSKLLSTGRRTCSIMRFRQRATITLRNLSCTLPGSLLGMLSVSVIYFVLYMHSVLLLYIFSWMHRMSNPSMLSIESSYFCSIIVDVDLECVYRDVNLHFVESPALAPPEVQIDIAAQQQ